MSRLEKSLEDKNSQLQASNSAAEKVNPVLCSLHVKFCANFLIYFHKYELCGTGIQLLNLGP